MITRILITFVKWAAFAFMVQVLFCMVHVCRSSPLYKMYNMIHVTKLFCLHFLEAQIATPLHEHMPTKAKSYGRQNLNGPHKCAILRLRISRADIPPAPVPCNYCRWIRNTRA